jgi:hypothetical protein
MTFMSDVPFGPYFEDKDVPPPLIWPSGLVRPSASVPLVYLDMNHWISLAQAHTGHASGARYQDVLRTCRHHAQQGAATFVLSSAHYFEMLKISDPTQRYSLGDVMEELTGFATLLGRVAVMEIEFDAAVDQMKSAATPLPSVALVGCGVAQTLGVVGGFRIRARETGADVTASFREEYGPERFDAYMATMTRKFERSVLCGPTDAEVESLRERGWNPSAALAVADRRAQSENELRGRLNDDDRWRRGRLRDLVSARELLFEFDSIRQRVLARRGLTSLNELGCDINGARQVVRSMPSGEVAIELKTAWHRNASKPWTANDIFDIDAMALAVPYCDVVVTEKACHHVLTTARLDERMQTRILRSLDDLPVVLSERRQK